MVTIETTLQLLEQLSKMPKEDIEYAMTLLLTQGKIDFTTISSAYVNYLELKDKDNKLKLADANTCTMSLLNEVNKKKSQQNYNAIHWALHNLNECKQFQMQSLNEKFGYNPEKDCEFSFYWRDTHK